MEKIAGVYYVTVGVADEVWEALLRAEDLEFSYHKGYLLDAYRKEAFYSEASLAEVA